MVFILVRRVGTARRAGRRSLRAVVDLIAAQHDESPGN
jgi:hypothetical protein